ESRARADALSRALARRGFKPTSLIGSYLEGAHRRTTPADKRTSGRRNRKKR
ncbi:unnamed protein product, partial [Musa acuminata subsp. burmannicoides]